jgi:hypothetical protein
MSNEWLGYRTVPVKYVFDRSKITSIDDVITILESFGVAYNAEIEWTPVEKLLSINPEWEEYMKEKPQFKSLS